MGEGEEGRSGGCPCCCVVSTWARVRKAALSFLACRGRRQTHPAKVVSCCYRMFQLSTVALAALSLQPIAVLWGCWQCSSHMFQPCGCCFVEEVVLSGPLSWQLVVLRGCLVGSCICGGMFSIWCLNSQCCKASTREKRYKEQCPQETTKDGISEIQSFSSKQLMMQALGKCDFPLSTHIYNSYSHLTQDALQIPRPCL